ncbi:MAG: hypothetical protein M2R45_00773 [Verrucomicrobia subdivision 3 bacterium]|nr:hypothetical protein [Limisphaerales bacterium]MCS1413121.1 hypothetical protein [Limisphaerales bacterium]
MRPPLRAPRRRESQSARRCDDPFTKGSQRSAIVLFVTGGHEVVAGGIELVIVDLQLKIPSFVAFLDANPSLMWPSRAYLCRFVTKLWRYV